MSEKLNSSPRENLWKLKNEKTRERVEQYERERIEYYKTKNRRERLTNEQRRTIDAEMNAKIDELYAQEHPSQTEAPEGISSIQEWLDAINANNLEDINIENFEFNNNIWFWSIQAIRAQAQLYVAYNEWIHKQANELSNLYSKFMQVVNQFNKEREDDTRWSGNSDYEQYVDEINQ